MKFLVSIIICTHNRSQHLKSTLDSIIAQEKDGGFDFEIIVVDNNSKDDTRTVVESYTPRFIGNLRYCLEVKQGKSYALNHGIQEAKGDIIAFTDDDVMVDPYWLYHLIECFEKYGCDGVGGRVVPVYPDRTPQWIKKHPTKLAGVVVIADYGPETKPYGKPMDPFIGSNYAFKRKIFDDCGLFRVDLGPGTAAMGEDTELIERLTAKGYSLYYCGAAVIRHPVDLGRLRLNYIAKWHMALGRFAAMNEFQSSGGRIIYCFGVPRYLFKGILKDVLLLAPSMFNRLSFYNRLRGFFRKAGMISEYRRNYRYGRWDTKEQHG